MGLSRLGIRYPKTIGKTIGDRHLRGNACETLQTVIATVSTSDFGILERMHLKHEETPTRRRLCFHFTRHALVARRRGRYLCLGYQIAMALNEKTSKLKIRKIEYTKYERRKMRMKRFKKRTRLCIIEGAEIYL